MGKLTQAFVKTAKHSGKTKGDQRHHDEHGLMLSVRPGSKSWVQRLVIQGRRRTFGLGAYPLVSLAEARRMAFENRAIARRGGDPLALRARRDVPDFATAAAKVIDIQAGAWKAGGKSRGQWESSLAAYVFPVFGSKPVDTITSADVLEAVAPLWNSKRETAGRVRLRVSAVLKWCVAKGYRTDDPAGAAVLQALPKGGGNATRHQRALPYAEVAGAVRAIRASGAWLGARLAFEFLVLCAARSGEVRGARWDEIDGDTWTVPAVRMKGGIEHRVPLSTGCLAVLETARRELGGELLFPSLTGKTMTDTTLSKMLHDNGIDAVPHGFRSSFRDWAAERTDAPPRVAEAALAHAVRNRVEAAYARTDLFERRRKLMEQWHDFLMQTDC